jgi:hypothetical protein
MIAMATLATMAVMAMMVAACLLDEVLLAHRHNHVHAQLLMNQ